MSNSIDHEVRRHDDGRKVYVVGPVERWLIGAAVAIFGTVSYNYGASVMSKLDNVQAGNIRIETAQAVSSSQYLDLKANQQLIRAEVAKIPAIEAQVKRNSDAIDDGRRRGVLR